MFTNERLFTIQAFTITRVHCTYIMSLTVIIRIVIRLWCCRNNINIIKVRRCSCFHNGNFPFWHSGCGVIVLVKSFLATVDVFLWQKWRDFQLWWSSGTAAAAERTVLSNYIVIRQTTNISFRNHIIPQFDILIKRCTIIRLQVFDIIPLLN